MRQNLSPYTFVRAFAGVRPSRSESDRRAALPRIDAQQNMGSLMSALEVKMRKPRNEHMSAGLLPIADIAQRGWHGRKVRGRADQQIRQDHQATGCNCNSIRNSLVPAGHLLARPGASSA